MVVLFINPMTILEVNAGSTMYINDDGDYCVYISATQDILPVELGPEYSIPWDADIDCPF